MKLPVKKMARAGIATAVILLGAGCGSPPAAAPDIGASPWAEQSGARAGAWSHRSFPGKLATDFRYARLEGRDVISVDAQESASMVRQVVRVEPQELGAVRFSWKVPQLIAQADMALRDRDDAPVRIVLAFEGDRSRFSAADAALSELVHVVTGEPMPYATLMYVWCNQREPDSVIRSPRTERVRKLVVETGARRLNQWLEYERDIRADYERVFGEPPGALVGIAIMSDSDNTKSHARAWYGPVRIKPASARQAS